MQKKNKGALNLAGLVLFLLALPFFFGMGGGAFAMAEVLPGQATASFLPYTEKAEADSARVFGSKDVEFSRTPAVTKGGRTLSVSAEEMARLRDFSYLRSSYYIIDSRTALLPSDIDAEEALALDFSIKKTTKEPKILIFHTHAHEGFADSDMSKGLSEGIWGAGEELKRILEDAGYETKQAYSGTEALLCCEKKQPDLIMLDLMLPGVDGFEICRKIREEKNTPIIMVSAKKDDIDKIRGLGLGADDYMTKPFSPSEMVARVKAHLARYDRLTGSAVEKNKIIEIRGLRIDTTARRVWVNDVEKTFTTKEFDLLTFLASHPNHVYTKEELFREIWDMESIGDIATVTVHIKKIREKVEVDTSNPQYIETIWGVGYRFKV